MKHTAAQCRRQVQHPPPLPPQKKTKKQTNNKKTTSKSQEKRAILCHYQLMVLCLLPSDLNIAPIDLRLEVEKNNTPTIIQHECCAHVKAHKWLLIHVNSMLPFSLNLFSLVL